MEKDTFPFLFASVFYGCFQSLVFALLIHIEKGEKNTDQKTEKKARDYTFFRRVEEKGRGGAKVQREWGGGKKKKENTCLACVRTRASHGPFSDRTGPHWLFFNLSLWTVRRPSPLSPTFHFMSALAGTLTSSSSFFIMFVSGCAVLSGKALVSRKKRPRIRERPNQVSPRQAGERGEGGMR